MAQHHAEAARGAQLLDKLRGLLALDVERRAAAQAAQVRALGEGSTCTSRPSAPWLWRT
ncbi:MAG: hypothetical protein U0838_09885 [Chloroflexota bacterium]